MLASQVGGAYQASAYAFAQQVASNSDQARVASAQEAPSFPQTNFGVATRYAASASSSVDRAPSQKSSQNGKGKLVDITA